MARLTRAQKLTGTEKRSEFYSDFMNSFAKSPVGDQLARVTNEKSINQALKNIILTNRGERLFQPGIGSDILAMLFENTIESNLTTIEFYIRNAIEINEPRVNLIEINIAPGTSEHEVIINIVYNTINNSTPVLFTYVLKRVR